jgi:hypothetical protein
VSKQFIERNGRLYNPRAEEILAKLTIQKEKFSNRGKAGAYAKHATSMQQADAKHELSSDQAEARLLLNSAPPLPLPLPQPQPLPQPLPQPPEVQESESMKRTPVTDPQWFTFKSTCRKRRVLQPDSEDDWRHAEFAWGVLDLEERDKALHDCEVRDTDSFEMRATPQVYLQKKWFTRDLPAPKRNSNYTEERRKRMLAYGGDQ